MRLFISISLPLLTAIFAHAAGTQVQERALGVADIPPCGVCWSSSHTYSANFAQLTCLLETVPAAGCSLLDTECQCKSEELTYNTAACMLANCTMADSLGTAKVQAELCNLPHESKSGILFASLTTVYATVCLFVALRLATRVLTQRVRIDDLVILAALLLATVAYASAYKSTFSTLGLTIVITNAKVVVQNNFGKHLWDLQPGQLQEALKYCK